MKLTAPTTDLYETERRVAVEIMGLPDVPFGADSKCPYGHAMHFTIQRAWCCDCERWYSHPYKDYRDDLNDAMEVVEKMWHKGWQMESANRYKLNTPITENVCSWWVRFINNENDMDSWSGEADTLPTAICLAALAAIEGE